MTNDNDYYQPITANQPPAEEKPTVTPQNTQPSVNIQPPGDLNPSPTSVPVATPQTEDIEEKSPQPAETSSTPSPAEPQDSQTPPADIQTPEATSTPPAEPPAVQTGESQTAASNASDEIDEKEFADYLAETKEKIISDLGFEGATQEQKDKILETIDKRIDVATTQAIIENATDEQTQEIKSVIEANGDIEATVEKIVKDNPELLKKIKNKISELYEKIVEESRNITTE